MLRCSEHPTVTVEFGLTVVNTVFENGIFRWPAESAVSFDFGRAYSVGFQDRAFETEVTRGWENGRDEINSRVDDGYEG